MKFTIKTLDQKNYQIDTCGVKTVLDLKRRLYNTATTNLLPERQQLMYAGRVLKDTNLLSNYSIDERKFLLVMSRKPSKAFSVNGKNVNANNNNNNNNSSFGNKKLKRIAETRIRKPNAGQGDEPDSVCTKKRKFIADGNSSKNSTNPKQIKRTKTNTTLATIKLTKKGTLPNKKVKILQREKSATSRGSSTQDECLTNRHFPTSISSIESYDSHHIKRHPLINRKNNKSIVSGNNRTNKMRTTATKQQHSTRKNLKAQQNKCDELVLRQIVAMGYNENDVRRALIASFNDPNEAVGFLIQQVQERIEQQSAKKQQQQQEKQQQQQNQQQPNPQRTTQKHCRIIAKVKSKKSNALAFLRHDPDFKNLRRVLRNRPNVLQNVIKRIGAAHPELLSLLKEHENDFLQLLHEASGDSEDEQFYNYKENQAIHISPEEEKIVARLVRMGFKRQMVILAFIACDRNVEKAVDYLCRISDIHI